MSKTGGEGRGVRSKGVGLGVLPFSIDVFG